MYLYLCRRRRYRYENANATWTATNGFLIVLITDEEGGKTKRCDEFPIGRSIHLPGHGLRLGSNTFLFDDLFVWLELGVAFWATLIVNSRFLDCWQPFFEWKDLVGWNANCDSWTRCQRNIFLKSEHTSGKTDRNMNQNRGWSCESKWMFNFTVSRIRFLINFREEKGFYFYRIWFWMLNVDIEYFLPSSTTFPFRNKWSQQIYDSTVYTPVNAWHCVPHIFIFCRIAQSNRYFIF